MTSDSPVSWQGTVEAIFTAPEAKVPMQRADAVEALAGIGLSGDRYALGTGAFSRMPGPRRQVTLVSAESLEAAEAAFDVALTDGEHRRNLVVRGVPLADLVKQTFRVGEAVLRGVGPCLPCGYLVRVSGQPEIREALKHRDGLRAEILVGGTIQEGDTVVPAQAETA